MKIGREVCPAKIVGQMPHPVNQASRQNIAHAAIPASTSLHPRISARGARPRMRSPLP